MERTPHFKVAVDVVVNEWKLPYEGTEDIKIVLNETLHTCLTSGITHHVVTVQIGDSYYNAYYLKNFNKKTTEWATKEFVDFFEVVPIERTVRDFIAPENLKGVDND